MLAAGLRKLRSATKTVAVAQLAKWRSPRVQPLFKSPALVLPASVPGSLGDAAMLLGLRNLLAEHGCRDLEILDYDTKCSWARETDLRIAGQLPRTLRQYYRWSSPEKLPRSIFINGADVLDGRYSVSRSLERLRFAAFTGEMGIPTTITGFSLRPDVPSEIAAAFRSLPQNVRLCSRDPASHERLMAFRNTAPELVADLAFLMPEATTSEYERATVEKLADARAKGIRLLGICPNIHVVPPTIRYPEARAHWVIDYMCAVCCELRERGIDFATVLLSHDYRGLWNDLEVCRRLQIRLRQMNVESICVDRPVHAACIKVFCKHLSAIVTGRMHCGIAALGVGTPVILFDYQGKVRGLLSMFGLTSAVSTELDGKHLVEAISSQVEYCLDNQVEISRKIGASLPTVLARARRNVAFVTQKQSG